MKNYFIVIFILFLPLISDAQESCKVKAQDNQNYFITPSCKEAVDSIYNCRKEDYMFDINWYSDEIVKLINKYYSISRMKIKDKYKHPFIKECFNEFIAKDKFYTQIIGLLKSKSYEDFINNPSITHYLSITKTIKKNMGQFKGIEFFDFDDVHGNLEDLKLPDQYKQCDINKSGDKFHRYTKEELKEHLPPELYEHIFKDLPYDGIKGTEKTIAQLCALKISDLKAAYQARIENVKKNLLKLRSAFDQNFHQTSETVEKNIFYSEKNILAICNTKYQETIKVEILSSNTVKNAINKTNIIYNDFKEMFSKMLMKNWSLNLQTTRFDTVNSLLSMFIGSPISKESKKALKDNMNKYQDFDSSLFKDQFFDFFQLNGVHNSADKQIHITLASLIYGAQHPLYIKVLLSHEIAHMYSHSDHEKSVLSKDTRDKIEDDFASCISSERADIKKPFEDIADYLSVKLIDSSEETFTIDHIVELATHFCREGAGRKHTSKNGHTPPKKRFYNFIKYSPKAQKALNCEVKETLCTVNFN